MANPVGLINFDQINVCKRAFSCFLFCKFPPKFSKLWWKFSKFVFSKCWAKFTIFGEILDSKLTGMLHYKEISYDESIDNIVGMIYLYDLYTKPSNINDIIKEVIYTPFSKLVMDLISSTSGGYIGSPL